MTALPLDRRRSGFTLGEMLVVLCIVAVMSAVLAPSVVRHVSAAKAGRIVSDVRAIADASRVFYRDTERWPATVAQLTARPATDGSATDLNGVAIPAELARNWNGPYLRLPSLSALSTGFGPTISATLGSTVTETGTRMLLITVTNVDAAEFTRVDLVVDGGDGASSGSVLYAPSTRTLSYRGAVI